jgi:multiple sugar transport system permease protein
MDNFQAKLKIGKILYLLVLLTLAAIFLLPIAMLVLSSFKTSEQIYSPNFTFIPDPFSLQNFIDAFNKINFPLALFNTLYLAFFNIIGVLIASSLAAYAFSAVEWKGRDLCFSITLATIMLPDIVLLIPQFIFFKSLGWYGNMLPLIIPYFCGLPFYIFLLRQFFISIPKDLADSARIDGASEFSIWKDIYLPLSKPALLIVTLFQFLITWNDLMKPSIYLINEHQYNLSLALHQFQSKLGGAQWGPLMAAVLIMLLPVVILFLFSQKYFVKGITMGGLKES